MKTARSSHITDDHFLVLTKSAGASIREVLGNYNAREEDIRAVVMAILPQGKVESERFIDKGLEQRIKCFVEGANAWCRLVVIRNALDRFGNPKLAPDGIRKMAFLVDFQRIHG